MTQLEKILKRREEERIKKEEREKKRAEKKAEKERIKKEKHKKILRHRQNQRYQKKLRAKREKEREINGDKLSWYRVIITKNHKMVKSLGMVRLKSNAYTTYHNAIQENQNNVLCPILVNEVDSNTMAKTNKPLIDTKYEIMIIEKIKDKSDKPTKLKNENGKFVNNVITNGCYKIIEKHDWLVEETYNVYGYNPKYDRKDCHFILDKILLKDLSPTNTKRIFIYNNRVVIQRDDDFDFITCKNGEEADRLYDVLDKKVNIPKRNKYVYFTGQLNSKLSSWFLNELEKKTGWTRQSCKRIHAL